MHLSRKKSVMFSCQNIETYMSVTAPFPLHLLQIENLWETWTEKDENIANTNVLLILSSLKFVHHLYCPKYIYQGKEMNDQAQLFSTGSSATLFTIAEESDLAMMKPKEKERYEISLL